jgi:photosystem II stability/assembly factor-like uncharacterized protein
MFTTEEPQYGTCRNLVFLSRFVAFRVLLLFVTVLCQPFSSPAQRWEALGPDSVPRLIRTDDYSLRFASGIGRVSMLRMLPGKSVKEKKATLFLGTPYGSLWERQEDEAQWRVSATDQLPHIGISDLAIHPRCPDIRYLATGDPDCILDPNGPALSSEFCQSRGIVKSMDGGLTWSDTAIGLWYDTSGNLLKDYWQYPSRKIARKLLLDPSCPLRITVVIHTYSHKTKTYDGYIFQSEDAGMKWHMRLFVEDGFLKDLEYKPGNGKVMYTAGRSLFRSGDRGRSWIRLVGNGLPEDSLVKRIEIAPVPSKKSHLYALVIYKNSRNSDIFLSVDNGDHFERIVSAHASPEWRTAIAVDPVNPELVFFSAGNRVHRLFRNQGVWKQEYTGGFIHDDVHDLTFPGKESVLYASTDGGIHSSRDSGKTWKDLSRGLNIAECWSVSVSQTGPPGILAGLQDCGTILNRIFPDSSAGWWIVRGGDGMATAFDHQDEYIMYANDGNNRLLSRSIDGGLSWSRNLLPNRNENALYQRPFLSDPERQGVIYTGMRDVYKSIDFGDTWKKISSFDLVNKSDKLVAMAITPGDTNMFYAAFSNPAWRTEVSGKLFRTSNGGDTWKDVSMGLSGASWATITSVIVNNADNQQVFVAFRGGSDIKIMKSNDQGASWSNYSDGLESDCDINAMIMDSDSLQTLYIATHHGVFKRNRSDKNWSRLGEGLPRVMVSGLDIRYDTGTLYAGTHGRGVWSIRIR